MDIELLLVFCVVVFFLHRLFKLACLIRTPHQVNEELF